MADFILFDEGAELLLASGLPATCHFGLSTKSVDATNPYTAADDLATSGLEITGTGYGRESQSEPTPATRGVDFTEMTWETLTATNWSATVRSCFLASSADGSGVLIAAWNLQTGGTPRDMSGASTTLNFTPEFSL